MRIYKFLFMLFIIGFGYYTGNRLPYYFSTQKPLDLSGLTGEYDPTQTKGEYVGKFFTSRFIPPKQTLANVLGDTSSNKRIEVDLTNQRLYAYEGSTKVYDFLISSGLWGKTPTGVFTIWTKLRYVKMEGGNRVLGTYYYLPNVPFTMFFANNEVPAYRGFGLHGTYWHSNFGHPMSHGCINMKTEEAEKIYYWIHPELRDGKQSIRATEDNPGTQVIIYGVAPTS